MIDVVSKEHYDLSMKFKDILATYKSAEDLINIGAYTRGSNPKIDLAIKKYDLMMPYLKQGIFEGIDWRTSMNELKNVLEDET
jgi:flagellum-specific ATP synthase